MKNYRFLGFLLELQVPGILLRSVKLPNSPNENHRFARFFAWGLRLTGRARVSCRTEMADFRHKYFARGLDNASRDDYIVYRSCETPRKTLKNAGSRKQVASSMDRAACCCRIRKEKNGLAIRITDTCEVGLSPDCSVFPGRTYFLTPPNSQTPQ